MASPKPIFERVSRLLLRAAYLAALGIFLLTCAQFYLPGKGFTYLVMFGDRESDRYLPELKAMNTYRLPDSHGYDGQWYAQIAMHPQLGDAVLRDAVDGVAYRARRILFCWTAYALAGGNPEWALQIFAVQNIGCWLGLAWLMWWRWFPATSWRNFIRWAGVLFSAGLSFSVRGSLLDGPSLLMIAGGMALLEAGRPWWSAAMLGVAGLGKETNVLAGAALAWPEERTLRGWAKVGARLTCLVLPLAVWLAVLSSWVGEGPSVGARNFALPLEGFWGKWFEIVNWYREGSPLWRGNALGLAAIVAQFLFFALRPRWREAWWRVGAAYAGLMIVLGDAVWEGDGGATLRVLLPMTLAFNVLVPRGRAWWTLLLIGNLSVVLTRDAMIPPERESYAVHGAGALVASAATSQRVAVEFDANWYSREWSRFEVWRWNKGPATVRVENPQAFALRADVSFGLRANDERSVIVREDGRELWRGILKKGERRDVLVRDVRLAPGMTTWHFDTDVPAVAPANADSRLLAVSLRDLEIRVTGREER
ncbi:MAG: glycosyltransferase family 87 protein [Opitutaceae bacterium]